MKKLIFLYILFLLPAAGMAQTALSELKNSFEETYKSVFITKLDNDSVYFTSGGNTYSIHYKFVDQFHLSVKDTLRRLNFLSGVGVGTIAGFLLPTYFFVEDSTVRIKDYLDVLPTCVLIGFGLGVLLGAIAELVEMSREPIKEADHTYDLSTMTIPQRIYVFSLIKTAQDDCFIKPKRD